MFSIIPTRAFYQNTLNPERLKTRPLTNEIEQAKIEKLKSYFCMIIYDLTVCI